MIRNIQRRYFEVWGNEEAQNVFLKGGLAVLAGLFIIQSIVLAVVSLRKPILVAVGKTETKVFNITPPGDELLSDELTRWVRAYAETHYTWDSSTVEKAHADASRFVGQAFVKAFNAANSEQVRVAKEKKLAQRVYISDLTLDPKALTARVTMDRILMVEGLRATNPFILDITFEYGPRTAINPIGIYITGEKIVTSQVGG